MSFIRMMTDSELGKILETFKAKKGYMLDGDHAVRSPAMTAERLLEIEADMGVILPDQFKRHLYRHGSGDLVFSSIYSPDPELERSLWTNYEYMPDNRTKFLPIADNGCGDYYGFPIVDGRCTDSICWADHDSDFAINETKYADFNAFIAEVALRM